VAIDRDAAIADVHDELPVIRYAALLELETKSFFISFFAITRAECAVYRNGCTDHQFRDVTVWNVGETF
jgi:hypothetical protein